MITWALDLKSKDGKARAVATTKLEQLTRFSSGEHPSKVIDSIRSALDDPDYRVRNDAARCVGIIGANNLKDKLFDICMKPHEQIRVTAALALIRLGEETEGLVLKIFKSDNNEAKIALLSAIEKNIIQDSDWVIQASLIKTVMDCTDHLVKALREHAINTLRLMQQYPERQESLDGGSNPKEKLSIAEAKQDKESLLMFTTYHPTKLLTPNVETLLVYLHVPGVSEEVDRDSRNRIKHGQEYEKKYITKGQGKTTKRNLTIRIVPQLGNWRFNPRSVELDWLEDWHCQEFRVHPPDKEIDCDPEGWVDGKINFYLGGVYYNYIDFQAQVSESGIIIPPLRKSSSAYQTIFVSYSHKDKDIVDQLENAYKALGNTYLRDVRFLKSGEDWNPTILDAISKADIFQLCWSQSAKDSLHVMAEWQEAYKQERDSFIRPVCWESPPPELPPELKGIQFANFES